MIADRLRQIKERPNRVEKDRFGHVDEKRRTPNSPSQGYGAAGAQRPTPTDHTVKLEMFSSAKSNGTEAGNLHKRCVLFCQLARRFS
jgi:hypothetical protein